MTELRKVALSTGIGMNVALAGLTAENLPVLG